jgi:hypothetical protein
MGTTLGGGTSPPLGKANDAVQLDLSFAGGELSSKAESGEDESEADSGGAVPEPCDGMGGHGYHL